MAIEPAGPSERRVRSAGARRNLLKAQMNPDLLTEDLKKARPSNQSFWLT
ncbi:hypothetical protein [Rhizobium sp. F40D2]